VSVVCCPQTGRGALACLKHRREAAVAMVAAAETSLDAEQVTAAFDAVMTTGAGLRDLAAALADDPNVLHVGAPPVVGRLTSELIARGSTTYTLPSCVRCGRSDRPLTRSEAGGVCSACRRHQLAEACVRCQIVKPVAGRTPEGEPVCARCAERPKRPCGICGHTRAIARRARDGQPEVCVNCFSMPTATCSRCGRDRPCGFATSQTPVCTSCAPRRTAPCAHCGHDRPPTISWPEGPVCVTCYDAALARRGPCQGCHQTRRLTDPPGPDARRCCDCAGLPSLGHVCRDCGIEDKLYTAGRCDRCSLAVRVHELLADATGQIPDRLFVVAAAIAATPNARTALNWLHKGAAARLLADIAAGRLELSHQALDTHPHPRAADYLRRLLIAHDVLDERDEAIARFETFIDQLTDSINRDADRRLIAGYAHWRVLNRLRRRAEGIPRPTTPTYGARSRLKAAVALLDWLHQRHTTLADASQADIDAWLTSGPSAYLARDFLDWATSAGHAPTLTIPRAEHHTGTTLDADQRWRLLARLLHDDTVELTDRVAGCLVLLYGQQLSRITTLTRDQIHRRDDDTLTLRLGSDPITIPQPLARLILDLAEHGRTHIGVGAPAHTPWLFPGHHPGRPLTAAHLGVRLNKLGIDGRAGRRAALTHLAAQVPAAVLAELLGMSTSAAVHWVHNAGGDWSRYAAHLARQRDHH
jgi:tetratricopeptide (TPR) repeat protein